MVNVSGNVKNQIIGVLVHHYLCSLSPCNYNCNKACKIDEYLAIKNCSCKKHLFDKLVLTYEDKILNTIEISLADKKVTFEKIFPYLHCFIGNYIILI